MKLYLLIILIFLSEYGHSLVSSPLPLQEDQWSAEARVTLERGKVEPNENKDSFQKAEINIYQVSLSHGLKSLGFGRDHFLKIDYKHFTSAKEEVNGQVFYEEDIGHVGTLTYGFNFVHQRNYSACLFTSISPLAQYNKDKFSNPRVDLWSLGFRSGLEVHSNWFLENLFYFGSGIPGKQNSYVALNQLLGLRLTSLVGFPFILKIGPYVELDLTERNDEAYDQAFSAAGRSDRIRAAKIGFLSEVSLALSRDIYSNLTYVQKLGGYDAAATNAFSLAVGINF